MAENLLGGLVFDLSHLGTFMASYGFSIVIILLRVHETCVPCVGLRSSTLRRTNIVGFLQSEVSACGTLDENYRLFGYKQGPPVFGNSSTMPATRLSRYADLMLDAMIAVLIFFFPGGFNIQMLGCKQRFYVSLMFNW